MPSDPSARPFRHLRWRTEEGILVVTVTEPQLQGYTMARSLWQELLALVIQHEPVLRMILDLQAVQSLTSEALRPLLLLRRTLFEWGGRLVLCNLNPVVAAVFRVTWLVSTDRVSASTFEVQPSVEAAMAWLNVPASSKEPDTGRGLF